MAHYPMRLNGRTRLVNLPAGATGEDAEEYLEEQERVDAIIRARAYYDGDLYHEYNEQKRIDCNVDTMEEVPEHERLHNYSTHVSECIDFVTDQLSSGFLVNAKAKPVQEIIDNAAAATDALTSDDDDVAVTCDTVLREALIAADVPYEVKWNPFDETVYYEFWEAECVEFVNPFGSHVSKVIRRERRWVTDTRTGVPERKEVEERVEYTLQPNEAGHRECRKDIYWDEEESPVDTEWLGLPILPWGLLRGSKKGLRSFRGESFITEQIMDAVRRYNALEQYGYLIARYNSHGSLVTIGDAAALQQNADAGIAKDVADVLSFPSGTNAFPLHLPTDPEMIEHQRKVLEESIYKKFGLTRVEPDTLDTLGAVSGYALEILNRKSEGTLSRVSRQWKKDWTALVNLTVDVYSYRQNAGFVALAPDGEIEPLDEDVLDDPDFSMEEGFLPMIAFWEVDPAALYPDRKVDITMGTGYIVDDVAVRDDFAAKLISQQEALRKRGYSDKDITKIMGEQKDASPQEGQIAAGAVDLANREEPADAGDREVPAQPAGGGSLRDTSRDTGGNNG